MLQKSASRSSGQRFVRCATSSPSSSVRINTIIDFPIFSQVHEKGFNLYKKCIIHSANFVTNNFA